MNKEEKYCDTCKHYIFCHSWGESKCAAKALTLIHGPIKAVDEFGVKRCFKYEKLNKGEKALKCHCDICYTKENDDVQ